MKYEGYSTEVTHEVKISVGPEETCLSDVVLFRLLIEPIGCRHLVNNYIGTVDSCIVSLPGIHHKEVSGLNGEVGNFTDMSRVCLGSSTDIIGLQILKIDGLVVPDTIHAVNRKFLIDAVDGCLYIVLTLIEVVLVYRTDGCLVQVGATH